MLSAGGTPIGAMGTLQIGGGAVIEATGGLHIFSSGTLSVLDAASLTMTITGSAPQRAVTADSILIDTTGKVELSSYNAAALYGQNATGTIEIRNGTVQLSVQNNTSAAPLAGAEQGITVSGGTVRLGAMPPTITAISPDAGSLDGGESIAVIGTNLLGTTAIRVGGVLAADVNVVNADALTFTAPAGVEGAKDVFVLTPDGAFTLPDAYGQSALASPNPAPPSPYQAGNAFPYEAVLAGAAALLTLAGFAARRKRKRGA